METLLSAGAVSLILWAASFIYFRMYLARRTSSERVLGEFRDEVGKLVADIDAATDRDVQLVEDRMKALRSLLEETEKRIGTMRKETDRRASEERAYAELGKRARPLTLFPPDETAAPAPAALPPARPSVQPAAAVVPPPLPVHSPAPVQDSGESREARFMRAHIQITPKDPPFSEQVAELHRAGFSAEIIAARLGKTIGEVDLAIALSGKMEEGHGDDSGN